MTRRRLALSLTTVARIKQARNVFCRGWRPIDAPGSRLISVQAQRIKAAPSHLAACYYDDKGNVEPDSCVCGMVHA